MGVGLVVLPLLLHFAPGLALESACCPLPVTGEVIKQEGLGKKRGPESRYSPLHFCGGHMPNGAYSS